MSKHIVIGAGIAGLTTAYLLKFHLGLDVLLIEKSPRVGGWIHSTNYQDALFELGPHSLRTHGSGSATLKLLNDLNFTDNILPPNPSAKNRFIYWNNSLHPIPSSLWQIFRSPLLKGIKSALLLELFKPKGNYPSHETLYDFISRRFNKTTADRLIDPIISGIFAGDPKLLSASDAFPALCEMEKNHRSLILASMKAKRPEGPPLITLKNGMESLPKKLEEKLGDSIELNTEVTSIESIGSDLFITTNNSKYLASSLTIATPPSITAKLLSNISPIASQLLLSIPTSSIVGSALGYEKDLLKNHNGFGHLIPSTENLNSLGIIYDSSLFPSQNGSTLKTRISVMIGGSRHPDVQSWSNEMITSSAISAAQQQLGINSPPTIAIPFRAINAIPQYAPGHSQKVAKIRRLCENYSHTPIRLIGSWTDGIGIGDLIGSAYNLAHSLGESLQKITIPPIVGT